MTSNSFLPIARASGLALVPHGALRAQHAHLNAGAAGTQQNDPLIWANGADFAVASSYVKTLDHTNAGRYAGYFQQNITLTSLPATAAHAGPDPAAAALGAVLQCRISCLQAPPGGSFGFWEAGATVPTISLAAGQTSSTLWRLSENDGAPGSDPYGHIHGRRFTATQPGVYKIGFTAVDTSTNGASGGPIHTPSAELAIWFQAGVCLSSVEPDLEEGHVHVRFGATAGFTWQLETASELGPAARWLPAGGPVTGADVFIEFTDDMPPGERRFYRVKGALVVP
jgi:hypothetical protein